jgi:hypothetical protein
MLEGSGVQSIVAEDDLDISFGSKGGNVFMSDAY